MQILNIQNHSSQTSFSAKVHLSGRKETLPPNVVKEINAEAKKIGRKKDFVLIYFGKPEVSDIGIMKKNFKPIIKRSRQIFVKSTINGVTEDKNVGYCVFDKYVNDADLAYINVMTHLKELFYRAKKIYSPKKS